MLSGGSTSLTKSKTVHTFRMDDLRLLPSGVYYSHAPAVRAGRAKSSAAASWSADLPCKEKFTSAHISWLRKQGDTGERSRQYFEDAEMDMFLLWTRIVQHGGIDAVSAGTI